MQKARRVLGALVCLLSVPAAVFAQASITGVVRDTSGAVLPGVTVEASSDVLIEKVRAVTTDSSGQYRIIDLRPGLKGASLERALQSADYVVQRLRPHLDRILARLAEEGRTRS